MTSIIDSVSASITPEQLAQLAAHFGEEPAAVARGWRDAVPMLLGGAVEAAAHPKCLEQLLPLLTPAPAGGITAALTNPAAHAAWEVVGHTALPVLFPDIEHATAAVIGSGAGLKTDTETALLTLAAPLVLAALGAAAGPTPTATSVRHLLAQQEDEIADRMPGELGRTLLNDVSPDTLDAPPHGSHARWGVLAAAGAAAAAAMIAKLAS